MAKYRFISVNTAFRKMGSHPFEDFTEDYTMLMNGFFTPTVFVMEHAMRYEVRLERKDIAWFWGVHPRTGIHITSGFCGIFSEEELKSLDQAKQNILAIVTKERIDAKRGRKKENRRQIR